MNTETPRAKTLCGAAHAGRGEVVQRELVDRFNAGSAVHGRVAQEVLGGAWHLVWAGSREDALAGRVGAAISGDS